MLIETCRHGGMVLIETCRHGGMVLIETCRHGGMVLIEPDMGEWCLLSQTWGNGAY